MNATGRIISSRFLTNLLDLLQIFIFSITTTWKFLAFAFSVEVYLTIMNKTPSAARGPPLAVRKVGFRGQVPNHLDTIRAHPKGMPGHELVNFVNEFSTPFPSGICFV